MKYDSVTRALAVSQTSRWWMYIPIAFICLSASPSMLLAQTAPMAEQPESSAAAAPSSMPLKSHGAANREDSIKKPEGTTSTITVVGSLAVVLGLFCAVAWALHRASPGGLRPLPPEAFELLGRAPLANRQQAHLLRFGNKLLLVSIGAAGTSPLAEITDPAEVERLTALCRQTRPGVATSTFRRMFGEKGGGNA